MERKKKARPRIRFYLVLLMFTLETLFLIGLLSCFILIPFVNYIWVPIVFIFVLNCFASIFIINTNVNSGYKISWLIALICLPLGGFILYLMYADKMTTSKMRKLKINPITEELEKGKMDNSLVLNEIKNQNSDAYLVANNIYKNSKSCIYKNTSLDYYSLGDYAFQPILEALNKATKFIFIEYFIIDPGIFFDSVYEILKRKAKEGVDVRLLYDDFGSVFKVKAYFYKDAIKDGIKCFAFNRCRPTVDIRQNNRDHRKIIVIDGIVGFTGGINIADEYINKEQRFGLWKDNCLKITGEAVNGLTNLFIANWNLVDKKTSLDHVSYSFETNKYLLTQKIKSDGYIQPFGDIPFDNEETARNAHLQLILKAKKSIYLSTPYLIPDEELLQALCVASESGIDVNIITPGIPDKKMIYAATRSFYNKLCFYGVKIYEYTPGFNHLKMMVVDDDFCLTGTVNFDYRSFYLHFENDLFIFNNSKIKIMKEDLIEMISKSKLIDKDKYLKAPWYRKLLRSILRVFAPLL